MADQEKSIKEQINEFLNQKNCVTDGLALIESKTGVNRLYLFYGLGVFLTLYLVVGYASSLVVALIGFLYPAYASVKAVESNDKDDDTKWLMYWVVYSAFNIAEFFTDIFLSWFPLYFCFKMIFLGWCMAPISSNGSVFLYHKFIAPFVLEHMNEADGLLGKAADVAKDLYGKAEAEAKKVVVDQVLADKAEKED